MDASNAVGAVNGTSESGIGRFAETVIDSLKEHEQRISDRFGDGLRADGPLMKMPDHISERFTVWESTFHTPEDLKLVAEAKRMMNDMYSNTSQYIADQVESKTKKVQLELAMKAVSKSTQGIQQLLSSQ